MTVISTIITRYCTAHASDSFLTKPLADGKREVVEDQQSKLVQVPTWRGVMGYRGLACLEDGWNTFDWLREPAQRASQFASPEAFVDDLAAALCAELSRRRFARPLESGLGIHFTAYEDMEGYRVPELFVLSRWTDESYQGVLPDYKSRVTRETYATWKGLKPPEGRSPEFGQPKYRLEVHKALLDQPLMFLFTTVPRPIQPDREQHPRLIRRAFPPRAAQGSDLVRDPSVHSTKARRDRLEAARRSSDSWYTACWREATRLGGESRRCLQIDDRGLRASSGRLPAAR